MDQRRIRVLKHGDTFALFDQYGDIRPSQNADSKKGRAPSNSRKIAREISVALTNPDPGRKGCV